jgi:hypothetical protein
MFGGAWSCALTQPRPARSIRAYATDSPLAQEQIFDIVMMFETYVKLLDLFAK